MNDDPLSTFVRHFQPISLDALNAKAAMLERLDNKYIVHQRVLENAAPALAAVFDILEIDHRRAYLYETCYFDDASNVCYHDHHQGRRRRMKVRVRRYVDAGLCFAEVKLKDKRGVTVKKRLKVPDASYGRLNEEAMDHVRRCWHDLYGDDWQQSLGPVLEMRYRRMTLVAKEGGERMTIDHGVEFLRDGQCWPTDDSRFIVEAKSANGNGIADSILRAAHQHPTNGCSKYCVGMSVTGAVQRYNRFRPALRKLGALPVGGPPEHGWAA